MARKLEKTAKQETQFPSEGQFNKLLKLVKGAEAEMSEAKGAMGSLVEKAVVDYNLHTDAFRVFRKYSRKSPAQAAEFRLHLLTYWDYGKMAEPEADLVETPTERKKRGRPKKVAPEVIRDEKDGGLRVVRYEDDQEVA